MTEVPSIAIPAQAPVADRIRAFVAGHAEMTGLDLYYELERTTPLLHFHTMLRDGPRNRSRNGLQQSYGDHNRLLMLGLDRLLAGDVEWYRGRLDPDDDVSDDALVECLRQAEALEVSRELLVTLWLAAALHDCGMLCGRRADVDVEDGVAIARASINDLCPEPLAPVAMAVLRHHDYIKGVFLGEVPVATVADDLDALPPPMHRSALAGLGLVQVAGAASLGEGRLSSFRIAIFDRCIAGTALDDRGRPVRLARLLTAAECAATPSTDPAALGLGAVEHAARAPLAEVLDRVPIHAWQRMTRAAGADERMSLLSRLATRWDGTGADHIVLHGEVLDVPALDRAGARIETASSGARLLVVDA